MDMNNNNSFISEKTLNEQIDTMTAESKDSITISSGKRVKIAIIKKSSEEYAPYEKHFLQYSVTKNNVEYAVIMGVK